MKEAIIMTKETSNKVLVICEKEKEVPIKIQKKRQ
jgi:hypothetical protein